MKLFISILVLCFIFGFSCDEGEEGNCPLKSLDIKTGQVCGCGGSDSLSITEIKANYTFANPCDATQNEVSETATNQEKWNELLAAFNWDDFTTVNVNTCNLCADGCDTWIIIQKDDMIHHIRFGDNSPEIEPIRDFIEKLDAWRQDFRQN